MYQINEKNLKYAYSKLKKYAYYFNSSNYLKDKIIAFEDEIKTNPQIFDDYSKKLNSLSLINFNMLKDYSIDYVIYPKKDTIELDDFGKISIKNVNLFIDMDFMFYLNDILFCFELYELYKEKNNNLFFGNKFDKKIERTETPLENNLLFDSYWPNYKAWKNEMMRDLTANDIKNSTLIKIDFQRCFYQTRFKLKDFLNKNNVDVNNPIVKIGINIYRLYSSKIFGMRNEVKENEIVQLPIGLPSSMIIQNILFSAFDNKVNSNSQVLRYSRYVDDVLILINHNISTKKNFSNLFDFISVDSNNQLIYVDVNSDFLEPLKLNNKKIELKNASSVLSLKNEVEKIILPSMMDFLEEETSDNDDNSDFEFGDSLSQSLMKSKINYYFENRKKTDDIIDYLKERKDNELLNLFPSWNKIINLLNNTEYYENFLKRIKTSIEHIFFINDDYFTNCNFINKIKTRFKIELDTAVKLLNKNYYLFDIEQKQIFNYLKNLSVGQIDFFPLIIKFEYIQLYYCYSNGFCEDNLQKSIELFENVNKYKLHSKHPINEIKCSNIIDSDLNFCNKKCQIIKKFSKAIKFKYMETNESKKQIKVAISSIKMSYDSICESDETGYFAENSYNLKDIKKIIKIAKDNSAEYLLLPEFCIPLWEIKNVLDYCIRNQISLITGVTHINVTGGKVTNNVLIYDHRMRLVLLKEKNYYPYEEKILLAKRGMQPLIKEPYYFIIDNGIIKYSTMTCFEATNIRDRAFMNDKIDVLFIPVYNKDTTYFSNIISSLSRDMSGFIIQANNSEYGDSRITGPMNSYSKEIVQLKGGENNYAVVGTLDFEKMYNKHKEMNDIELMLSECVFTPLERKGKIEKIDKKIKLSKKENPFKPLSAGSSYDSRKKDGLD